MVAGRVPRVSSFGARSSFRLYGIFVDFSGKGLRLPTTTWFGKKQPNPERQAERQTSKGTPCCCEKRTPARPRKPGGKTDQKGRHAAVKRGHPPDPERQAERRTRKGRLERGREDLLQRSSSYSSRIPATADRLRAVTVSVAAASAWGWKQARRRRITAR